MKAISSNFRKVAALFTKIARDTRGAISPTDPGVLLAALAATVSGALYVTSSVNDTANQANSTTATTRNVAGLVANSVGGPGPDEVRVDSPFKSNAPVKK